MRGIVLGRSSAWLGACLACLEVIPSPIPWERDPIINYPSARRQTTFSIVRSLSLLNQSRKRSHPGTVISRRFWTITSFGYAAMYLLSQLRCEHVLENWNINYIYSCICNLFVISLRLSGCPESHSIVKLSAK